jgi:acetoin utilization protein AcuB
MHVSDVMTRTLVTVPPQTPVFDAQRLMAERRIRHLLVVSEAGSLEGIVTDRDIRLNMPSQATSLSVWEVNHLLIKLSVAEVMSRSVISVSPGDDVRVAGELMLEHRIGALPVLDAGQLVGIATETDLLRAFVRSEEQVAALRSPAWR